MLLKQIHRLIRAGRLLDGIDPAQLRRLLSLAHEIAFKQGEVMFQEGDKSSYLYLLVSGDFALELSTGAGPYRVETLGPGDDVLSLCDHNPEIGYVLMRRLVELISDRLDSTRLQLVRHAVKTGSTAGR